MSAAGGGAGRAAVLAHVTDPHFGRHEPAAIEGLLAALRLIAPDLVVVGGDLTQRSRSGQFTQARAFLDALPVPWLAVPGNHDVPLHNLFRRVFTPLGRFRRAITDDRAPLFVAPGLRLLGLDSTRRKIGGRLKPEKIGLIARLAGGEPGALRVLVTHHPLVRRPLEGAAAALKAAERAGVDVVLAGHHHNAHVTPGPILAVEGPSLSHCLEPVKGFFVVGADAAAIEVALWTWDGQVFAPGAPERFPRRNHALSGQ